MANNADNNQLATREQRILPPLESAADWNPESVCRMRIDEGLNHAFKETARRRAPTEASIWRHRKGVAGEVAAATYFGVSADWSITDDYVGDEGYDFLDDGDRIEVKTRANAEELAIPVGKIDDADYFVLAQCSRPDEVVRLKGSISRPKLKRFGHRFDGKMRVEQEKLAPTFEPRVLLPDKVRDIQGV